MPKLPVPAAALLGALLFLPRALPAAPADPEGPPAAAPGAVASADQEAEEARLHALPASHIPLKGATLASASGCSRRPRRCPTSLRRTASSASESRAT